MAELAYSFEESEIMKEEGSTLPLHPSCGKFQKGNDEESVDT
jgi:hypothetical protein